MRADCTCGFVVLPCGLRYAWILLQKASTRPKNLGSMIEAVKAHPLVRQSYLVPSIRADKDNERTTHTFVS